MTEDVALIGSPWLPPNAPPTLPNPATLLAPQKGSYAPQPIALLSNLKHGCPNNHHMTYRLASSSGLPHGHRYHRQTGPPMGQATCRLPTAVPGARSAGLSLFPTGSMACRTPAYPRPALFADTLPAAAEPAPTSRLSISGWRTIQRDFDRPDNGWLSMDGNPKRLVPI